MTDSLPTPTDASAAASAAHQGGRVPRVVFACRANGGRSVASRLLTEHYAQGRVEALSAGTEPGELIHPEVADVLEQLGLDTSRETPKLLTAEMIADSDLAITMGCGENCPYVPGARYRDWPLDDPKNQDETTVRRIVADIDGRVRDLLVELVPDIDLSPSVLNRETAGVELTGIHHVKLPVSDLGRSREWYERVLGYAVEWEFPDDDGVVRGVGGRLPGAGVPVALRQNAQAAGGNAGFDPVSFAIADRAAAEAWAAHFDSLGVRHSGVRSGTRGWVVDVVDPDGLTVRLYSTADDAEDHTNQPGYGHAV